MSTEHPTQEGEKEMDTNATTDGQFTITDADYTAAPAEVTAEDVIMSNGRRRWPVITAALAAALAIGGGGGLIAYNHHHAAAPEQQSDEMVCTGEGLAASCHYVEPDEGGHVWGTQPGEGGGNLGDLQDGVGGCPSHMIYLDGVCVSDDRKFDPSSCESGVIVLNPVPRCETMREKTADEFRQAIEQQRQENNPPMHHLTDGLSPAARAATQE